MAHFTITGHAIAQAARGLMLDGDPGKAWRLLSEGLPGIADDQVRALLEGQQDFVGDSNDGIDVVPAEDSEELRTYLKDVDYIYAGRVRLGGRWYRPRAVVDSFGPRDATYAMCGGSAPTRLDKPAFAAWCTRRAQFYAGDGERVELANVNNIEEYVIFEPCGEPPQWRAPARDAQAACDAALAAGRGFEKVGAAPELAYVSEARQLAAKAELDEADTDELLDAAYAVEDEAFALKCEEISARVRERAGADVFPMELLDGTIVQVPRAPFARWALGILRNEGVELPDWAPEAESGMKMNLDDPCHTDWMLGAGLSLDDSYKDNINKPAWEHASRIQIEAVDRV